MARTGFLLALTAALLIGTLIPLTGQAETIITVGMQEWQISQFNESLFDDFEAEHPGVKVVLVSMGNDTYIGGAAYDSEDFMERSEKFAQIADVLSISTYAFSVESVRAGHFLNLEPLIAGDADFDEEDFFPVAWESVAWDDGVWGLPLSLSVETLLYNATAFDEAGLAYPDENWTLTEFGNAARELTEVNEDGEVVTPGFLNWNLVPFIVALTGETLYDDTTTPATPDFSKPGLLEVIEQYRELQTEQVMMQYGSFDYEKVPMRVEGLWRVDQPMMDTDDDAKWQASFLPGGRAIVRFEGVGVSGFTAQPELAYELVKYMSLNPEITNRFFGDSPARQSLVGVEVEDNFMIRPERSPETQAIIDEALQNGISFAETRFGEYVLWGINPRFEDEQEIPAPEDTALALEEAQAKANEVLEIVSEHRSNGTTLAVATAVPTPVLTGDEIALTFRLSVPYSPLPNREQWDQVIADFIAQDPEVGNIDLISGFGGPGQEEITPDCYYDSFTNVEYMDTSTMINFDPFTDADPNFDENDFVPGVLDGLRIDGKLWGYPIALQPSMLQYNNDLFEQAGLSAPETGWTIDEFVYALQTLQDADLEDVESPFMPQEGGNTYLFMLMAAYGATPIDYSTQPSTVNFTDNIDVIRQVLNMAKDGLIAYQELDNMGGGGFGGNAPLSSTSFSSLAYNLQFMAENPDSAFVSGIGYTTYPVGSELTPITYTMGNAYISSEAVNPEACYRWISTMSQHPELLLGMPVRTSQLSDPALADALTPQVASLFTLVNEQLNSQNVIVVPNSMFGARSYLDYVESMWVNQAFDNYVLEDADLETELAEADRKINELRTCGADFPELTPSQVQSMTQEEITEHYDQLTNCIISVDPALESRFRPATSSDDE